MADIGTMAGLVRLRAQSLKSYATTEQDIRDECDFISLNCYNWNMEALEEVYADLGLRINDMKLLKATKTYEEYIDAYRTPRSKTANNRH